MTQAQADAHLCGLSPHEHDARFVAQHLAAYAFAKRYAQGQRVLEVGFGSGYGTAYLAEVAGEVIGIDMAPGNIPRASAAYPHPNLKFLQMDATRLEFPDHSFDLVCSFQVIEHIPEQLLISYLSEISRVLRPSGLFCVSTLNLAHNMKPGTPYDKLIYHEKEFAAPELEELLRRVFPAVEMRGLHLTWTHRFYQRLKKWGVERIGPPSLNPVARFYEHASPRDFVVTPDTSLKALDLLALCHT
jgi:ubiquinone/menaquinone biosynthesis C-methylase UbiE